MTTDTHDPNASTLAMIAGAGLCPARISSISGGYSANLWRVDGHDGHPVAVLKRAASSSARVTAERAALDHITRHAPEALRAHTPPLHPSPFWCGERSATPSFQTPHPLRMND